MAKSRMWRRVLGLALSVIMLLGMAMPAFATGANNGAVSLKPVDNSVISAELGLRRPDNQLKQEEMNFGNVRVSIVLEDKSTIEAGYGTQDIADNAAAMAYRATLASKQEQIAQAISAQALGGAKLDVVWNLTLAANIISANVPYQRIEAIKAVPGVAGVVLETRYEPAVVSKGDADPNMATSSEMIGTPVAYGLEYTGAGSRIAIIDTGTDTDHQSFNDAAFEEAIVRYAVATEKISEGGDFFDAEDALGLLTVSEIQKYWKDLHIFKDSGMPNVKPANVYLSSKLPFAFNYIDKDLDVTHDNDTAGEHGSHVAGIATANSLIKKGKTFVEALDEVFVQGVAPEAQLLTMKVFGKGGGAYDSDYMVAIEDAIILKCDAINLSLGSSAAGPRMSATYQGVMESLAKEDVVVVMSAGNAGTWADNALGLGAALGAKLPYLYAGDVSLDTVGSPASFGNSLSVASVDNTGYTGNYVQVGGNKITYSDSADSGYGNKPMTTLDTSKDGSGTEYEYICSVTYNDTGDLVPGIGAEEEVAAIGAANLKGKIFICQRGTTSFFEKANAAAAAGAVGTIIWNNTTGTIGLNLTGYKYTAPCVSILQADGLKIFRNSTAQTDEDGKVLYYTGKITVSSAIAVIEGAAKYPFYTMSSFSSWGVPGDLSLKPEITAPGGNIYSVNGVPASGDAYEQMSGTSMAAPQITGMVALVAQYLRETYPENEGDAVKAASQLPDGLSARQLAQSLLMSTAKPMLDGDGYFYPVLQQGAGLADVGAAVTAHSYITVDGQEDGKVKVELGDDPNYTGVYTFKFTLHNLTGETATYELSADVFTQYLLPYKLIGINSDLPFMMDTSTDFLEAVTVFSGSDVATSTVGTGDEAETVYTASVSANSSVEITVSITLDRTSDFYACCAQNGYTNGAYVEAYVWADELPSAAAAAADDEGVEPLLTSHSIPLLGFYGNWSDPSMYDKVSYMEVVYDVFDGVHFPYLPSSSNPNSFNTGTNYITANSKAEGQYIFGGNPLAEAIAVDVDYEKEMARSALNNTNGDMLAALTFSNIRNAGNAMLQVVDAKTGEVYYRSSDLGPVTAAYYYASQGAWQSIAKNLNLSWKGTKQVESEATDEDGNTVVVEEPLVDGAQLLVQLVLAPELYGKINGVTNEDGTVVYKDVYDWNTLVDHVDESGNLAKGKLGDGAYLEFPLTIDTKAPYDVTVTRGGTEETKNTLTITAKDNGYIAAIAIYNEDGTRLLAQVDPNIEYKTEKDKDGEDVEVPHAVSQTPGEPVSVEIDMGGAYGTRFYVAVYDYALNQATFSFEESFNEADYSGAIIFQDDANNWSVYQEEEVSELLKAPVSFTAATYVDGYIFGADEEGNLYVTDPENLDVAKLITNIGLSFEDMTYNAGAADGKLYGIVYELAYDELDSPYVVNKLYSVDKLTGEAEFVMDLYDIGLYDPTTIACDGEGTFYSIDNGDGRLYSYTLDSKEATGLGKLDRRFNDAGALEYNEGKLYWAHYVDEPPYFDANDNGVTNAADAQYILEYLVGNKDKLDDWASLVVNVHGDINGDGKLTTADAQRLLTYINEPPVGHLVEIDLSGEELAAKTVFSLDGPLNALIFPKEQDGEPEWRKAAQQVASVVLDQDELDVVVNETAQLTAYVTPWTLTEANKAVTWSSSDTSVATVDANGVVTGIGAGTAEITATSTAKNAEGVTVSSAPCTVTVTTIPYTLKGALQDEDGEAKLYTYNLEAMTKPQYGMPLSGARAIASTSLASDGNVYVADDVDGSYAVHKVDPETGADIESWGGAGLPLCDISTSIFKGEDGGDLLSYVYASYLFPMYSLDELGLSGYNLGATLRRYTGASELVAITSGGADEVKDNGETLPAEWIWAVDNAGYVWYLDLTEGGLYLGNFFPINFPGETPSFQGYSEANYCSLVESDDGEYLFLAVYNEDYGSNGASEVYMLALMRGASGYYFDAKRVANVGDGVWPATLYSVESNVESGKPGTDAAATLRETVSALGRAPLATMSAQNMTEMVVEKAQSAKDEVKTSQSILIETAKNAESELENVEQPKLEELVLNKDAAAPMPVNGSLMAVSSSAGKSDEGRVGADVTAEDSVNGLLEVTYDAEVLTLAENGLKANLPRGAIYAVNASEDGKVVLAYASPEKLDGEVFHLDFTYDVDNAPYTTVITVKTVEENDAQPEDGSHDIMVTLKEAITIAPPTMPKGEEPEPEPEPTVTDNDDGSKTTTVVDKETGTVTETTEQPDGTITETVTEPDGTVTETVTETDGTVTETVTETDGTVTETVTETDGTVVEKVTDPEENVSITVTDSEGEVLVNVVLPAEVPETETRFDDVPEGHWADEAIHDMAAMGVVQGVGDNVFDMEAPTTRGMLATILFRMSNGGAGYEQTFDDVDEDAYYTDAVAWAAKTGVVTGVSADSFAPDDEITREQLVTMLYRYARLLNLDTTVSDDALSAFADADQVSSWARDAMAWCVENGIIFGVGGNNLEPSGVATRAQVAVIFDRFMSLMK